MCACLHVYINACMLYGRASSAPRVGLLRCQGLDMLPRRPPAPERGMRQAEHCPWPRKEAHPAGRARVRARTHARMHAYMHTCIHAYMHACMHTCIHASVHTCIHAYLHAYVHACMHTCIHTFIHAYMLQKLGVSPRGKNNCCEA